MSDTRPTTTRRRWWLRLALATAWWTLEGFTTGTSYHRMGQAAGNGMSWGRALEVAMWSAWLWIPLTMLALWLADRFPLDRDTWRRVLPIHVAAAAAVCVARAAAVAVLNPVVGWYVAVPPVGQLLLTSVANNLFPYLMLVGAGHALVYARRWRERDEALARAELHSLKMQLHPHFLFNTLNTVTAFVRTDPDAAERMIVRLSALLRHALQGAGQQEVSLEEELRLLRTYLDIEQVRFEDRLRVQWRIDPAAHGARVPHLILQPLVENAIRHGIAPHADTGTIEIVAERRGDALHLAVGDDGAGIAAPDVVEGVGLANTRTRLRQLYGARQRLQVTGPPAGGVRVEMDFPFAVERP